MAYTANEFQVIATGQIGPSEVWANTWTILDLVGGQDRQIAVNQVRGFYNDIIALLAPGWSATGATIRPLSGGPGTAATWAAFSGTNTSALMPTQLAIRVSLDDLNGHNGGPYIPGFSEDSNDADGLIVSGHRTTILNSVDALASGLGNEDFQLRIDRPSVTSTVAALRGRVGRRWDVVRRRSDAVPETYSSVSLT